jgi:integrase/recombinase XerD
MSATLQGSTFDQLVDRYLRQQRSLGRAYVHEERVIDALRRFLQKNGRTDLDRAIFETWCTSQGHLSAKPTCFVQDIHRLPHRRPYAPPVIFGGGRGRQGVGHG